MSDRELLLDLAIACREVSRFRPLPFDKQARLFEGLTVLMLGMGGELGPNRPAAERALEELRRPRVPTSEGSRKP